MITMDLVNKQREERKQRILEVARRLMADRGYDGVTMRELADESLVSVPTLYNLFGGKGELLFAAVQSYMAEVLHPGAAEEARGFDKIVALVEHMSEMTVNHAAYARSLMVFFNASTPDAAGMNALVGSELIRRVREALEEMRAKRQLADWTDLDVLSQRVAAQLIITTLEWSNQSLTDAGLASAQICAAAFSVLGVARGKAAVEIETLLREHQAAARATGTIVGRPGQADAGG